MRSAQLSSARFIDLLLFIVNSFACLSPTKCYCSSNTDRFVYLTSISINESLVIVIFRVTLAVLLSF